MPTSNSTPFLVANLVVMALLAALGAAVVLFVGASLPLPVRIGAIVLWIPAACYVEHRALTGAVGRVVEFVVARRPS
jgi:hypothetical protein